MKFEELELKEYINKALENLKFKELTKIQEEIIPLALKNNSLIGQSRTGSGKTHSFLIPIFQALDEDLKKVQAVITAPTRELALQIYNVANHIASYYKGNIDIRIYTGGSDRLKEIERLNSSQPQIVIGTPGKIKDLVIKENVLKIYTAKTLVVDEADMSFEIGFLDDLDKIASVLDNPQIMVFSATINESILPFIRKYIETTKHINIKESNNKNIRHILLPIRSEGKYLALRSLLKTFNPYLCLIFANTKKRAIEVSDYLKKEGYKVCLIHGDIQVRERKRLMREIQELKYQYIVASDIASRGIDIEGVSHVVNFELPSDYEFYIHRSGRTGRMNMDGICYSLYDFDNKNYLESLEKKGIKFEKMQIKNNELIPYKGDSRKNRVKPMSSEEKKIKSIMAKPKRVTPGYKKKRQEKIDKILRGKRK